MGHKRLDPATGRARHIAVRLTDQDRAWVMEQARARGVSAAAILRAGLALLRAPQGASPDLLVGDQPADAQRQRRYEYVEVGVDSIGSYRRVGSGPKAYYTAPEPFTMGPAWRAALAAGVKKNPRR